MERKVPVVAFVAVALVALATWLVVPTFWAICSIDKLDGTIYFGSYELPWVETYYLYQTTSDIDRAIYFYPVSTMAMVGYFVLFAPFWPLIIMVARRKLRRESGSFWRYTLWTLAFVGLGLLSYRVF